MVKLSEMLDAMAVLVEYPSASYRRGIDRAKRGVLSFDPTASEEIAQFEAIVSPMNDDEIEELFTRTFDLNPVAALDIGWHLYGEQYERGRFLVRMRDLLTQFDIDEGGELPDNLPSVLRALGLLCDIEAEGFAKSYVLPALEKINAPLEASANPYAHVVRAIRHLGLSLWGEGREISGPVLEIPAVVDEAKAAAPTRGDS